MCVVLLVVLSRLMSRCIDMLGTLSVGFAVVDRQDLLRRRDSPAPARERGRSPVLPHTASELRSRGRHPESESDLDQIDAIRASTSHHQLVTCNPLELVYIVLVRLH